MSRLNIGHSRARVYPDDGGLELTPVAAPSALVSPTAALPAVQSAAPVLTVGGKLSPYGRITVTEEVAKYACIPLAAKFFCFAYPAVDMEEVLEQLHLADERWAFFLLLGGFIYFGAKEDGTLGPLLQCNALSLVPSIYMLHFSGPHRPVPAAVAALGSQGRLVDVTLDPLEHVGFVASAWVHPGEQPGGLNMTYENDNPNGGFVFERTGGLPPVFFELCQPDDGSLAEFRAVIDAQEIISKERSKHRRFIASLRASFEQDWRDKEKVRRLTVGKEFKTDRFWVLEAIEWDWRGMLMVAIVISVVLFVGWLGMAWPAAYEMCSTFIWYSCFVWAVWTALSDTTAQSVLQDSRWRRIVMHSILIATPCLLTVLSGIGVAQTEVSARERIDLTLEILSVVIMYIVLPLTLYWFRYRIAMMLEERRRTQALPLFVGGEDAAKMEVVTHFKRTAVVAKVSRRSKKASRWGKTTSRVIPAELVRAHTSTGIQADDRVLSMAYKQSVNRLFAASSQPGYKPFVPFSQTARDYFGSKAKELGSHCHYKNNQHYTPAVLRAATKLQSHIRARQMRRRYLDDRKRRQKYLLSFSTPIFIASLIDFFAANVILDLDRTEVITLTGAIFFTYACSIFSFAVLLYDHLKPVAQRPRFSLAHCIFYVGVIWRYAYRATPIMGKIWLYLNRIPSSTLGTLGPSWHSMWVTYVTTVIYYILYSPITALATIALQMVATKNACIHLLFPLQMFEYLFLHAFFSLRTVADGFSFGWFASQLVVNLWLIVRNSGTAPAIGQGIMRYLFGRRRAKFMKADPNDDPLFKLQTLARMGIQYDLAEAAALIITPTLVSLLLWRDGIFFMEEAGVIVRHCDFQAMWIRFIALFILKPIYSTIARAILARAMRQTLLGRTTIHGTSAIAAGILAGQALTRYKSKYTPEAKAEAAGANGNEGVQLESAKAKHACMRHMRIDADVDLEVHAKLGLLEEELAHVRDDLSLTGLNFKLLRAKQMRRWRFYSVVSILLVFSTFRVRVTAPMTSLDRNSTVAMFHTPRQSVWHRVSGDLIAKSLRSTYDSNETYALAVRVEWMGEGTGGWNCTTPAGAEI